MLSAFVFCSLCGTHNISNIICAQCTFSSSIHLFHNRHHNCHNHHLYPKACLQLQLLNFQAVSCLRLSLCLTALFELSLSGLEIEGETISKEIFSESPIFQGNSPINGIWIKSSGFDPNDGFNHVIKSQMIKSLIWDLIQMRNLIINSDGLWWPSPSSDHITKSISSLLSSHLTKLTIGEGWESFQRIWFCASSPVDLPKLGICSNWLRERFFGGNFKTEVRVAGSFF